MKKVWGWFLVLLGLTIFFYVGVWLCGVGGLMRLWQMNSLQTSQEKAMFVSASIRLVAFVFILPLSRIYLLMPGIQLLREN